MSLTNILELEESHGIACLICSEQSEVQGTSRCGNCRGTGRNNADFFEEIKHIGRESRECPSCEGTKICIFCRGSGLISESR